MIAADLTGKLIRLTTFDLEKETESLGRWDRDSEYQRLLFSGPIAIYSPETIRGILEKEINEYGSSIFAIHSLADDFMIGFTTLGGFNWQARSAWVGIGIGEPEYRGKGFGTDAMKTLAGYAFKQLNLNRINLAVFEYNPRAIRSYEKCGFVHEGSERQALKRGEQRWDLMFMGLLREDWLARQ